jgi:(p)ppGpp synthase/HD superfamily hydrolase
VKPWSELTTGEFASEIVRTLLHAIQAHTDCPRSAEDAVRRFDGKTPYAVHPLWCAMTILLEAQLDAELRRIGYQALAWHDTLEDTTLGLPDTVDPRVRALVEELTFARDEDERVLIWQRSRDAKLLKLYDKVANLLDNRTWRPAESWNAWAAYTLELARFVEGEFGRLNIVRIAHALAAS